MKQEEKADTGAVGSARVIQPAKPSKPHQIKQLVRTIGVTDTPESQSVHRVNAELAAFLNDGWVLHTVRPIGSGVGGSVVVYYLLTK
jgi:hypothetical protein